MYQHLLKSFLLSIAVGATVGSVCYLIVAFKLRVPFNSTNWIITSGIFSVACLMLTWRDSHQKKKVIEGRELNEAGAFADPLVAIINSDSKFSFKPVTTSPNSGLFNEKWFLNSKTMDSNTSIVAVNLKVTASGSELHQEINRVARAACGGSFFRTQLVGAIIFCPRPCEIDLESLITKSYAGRSGIIWAVLVNDSGRSAVGAKFDYPTKAAPIYSKILGWFREQNYEVKTELVRTWTTEMQGKGRLGILMGLLNRSK